MRYIEIDGRRYLRWDILHLRREQKKLSGSTSRHRFLNSWMTTGPPPIARPAGRYLQPPFFG